METQLDKKGGLANNLPLQMTALGVAALIIIVLAWKYLW